MTIATLLFTAGGIGLIAALARYFFKPGVATVAAVSDDGQEVTVVVQGGYQPNLIHATPVPRSAWCLTAARRGLQLPGRVR